MKVVVGAVLALGGCARWDDTCVPAASWTVPVRWSDGQGLDNVQGQYAWSARGDGTSVLAIGPPVYGDHPPDIVIAGVTLATPALATISPDGELVAAFGVPVASGGAPDAVVLDDAGAITAQWTGQSPCSVVHYAGGVPAWQAAACGSIAAAPDGAIAYATDMPTSLDVVEADGTARWAITLPDDPQRIHFADAGHLVVQTLHAVQSIDARTGAVLAMLPGFWFAADRDGVLVLRYETEASTVPVVSMFGFDGTERWTRRDPLPEDSAGLAAGRVVLAGKVPSGSHLRVGAGFDAVVVLDAATGDTLAATETCPTFGFRAVTATGALTLGPGVDVTGYEVPGL